MLAVLLDTTTLPSTIAIEGLVQIWFVLKMTET